MFNGWVIGYDGKIFNDQERVEFVCIYVLCYNIHCSFLPACAIIVLPVTRFCLICL